MKKLLLFAIAAAALYLAWGRFRPSAAQRAAGSSKDTTPAANASQRVNNLSGAAPDDH